MSNIDAQDCVRKRVEIGGENFDLFLGKNFVQATTPYENRPENLELRRIVTTLCEAITLMMGGEVDGEDT